MSIIRRICIMRTKMVLVILGIVCGLMCTGCGSTVDTSYSQATEMTVLDDGVRIIFHDEETEETGCPLEGVTLEGARIPSWIE
jgi:hypothetical protein